MAELNKISVDSVGDGCGGLAWRPRDFGKLLERQATHQLVPKCNEVCIDGDEWNSGLPYTIEAFTMPPGRYDLIGPAREQFLKKYTHMGDAVPVVEFDVNDWDTPFGAIDDARELQSILR